MTEVSQAEMDQRIELLKATLSAQIKGILDCCDCSPESLALALHHLAGQPAKAGVPVVPELDAFFLSGEDLFDDHPGDPLIREEDQEFVSRMFDF